MRSKTLPLLALLLLTTALTYAEPQQQLFISIYNNSNILDIIKLTRNPFQSFNYSKTYPDNTTITISSTPLNMSNYTLIYNPEYYFVKKPDYQLNISNISVVTSLSEGNVLLKTYSNYPTKINVSGDDVILGKVGEVYGTTYLPLYYHLSSTCYEGTLNVSILSPIQKTIPISVKIKVNESNKPIISNIIKPKDAVAGTNIKVNFVVYDDTNIKEVLIEYNNQTQEATKLTTNLYSAVLTSNKWGKQRYTLKVMDIFNNTATRTFTIDWKPRGNLITQDVLLVSLKRDYEYIKPILQADERISVAYKWIKYEWKPLNNQTNETQEPTITLLLDDNNYQPITSDWTYATAKDFKISILSREAGDFYGILEFKLPKTYKVINNRSIISFKTGEDTIEESINMSFGTTQISCKLDKSAREYVCQTKIPADKEIRDRGVFINKEQLDNMINYYKEKEHSEKIRKNIFKTLFTTLLLLDIAISIFLLIKYLLSSTRFRW